jgi:hypothetical protein
MLHASSVKNATNPRRSAFVHAYGHEVTGLKTYRAAKRKQQRRLCSNVIPTDCPIIAVDIQVA